MNFIQFVAPLIGGYWFLARWNYSKFAIKEDSGYHLFFKSSVAGIIFLIIATVLLSLEIVADLFEYLELNIFIPKGFDFASILAMILAAISPYVLNAFYAETKGLTRSAEKRGKFLFLTIKEAIERAVMVEVTLNSGKIHIGSPFNEIQFESEYLNLIPYLSGYRDNTTKELVIIRKYSSAIGSMLDDDSDQFRLSDFRVVVPVQGIASARPFHPEFFERFKKDGLGLKIN